MEIYINECKGKLTFKIILLNEYDFILGLELFDSVRAMIDMRTKSVIITDPQCPSVIPMIHGLTEIKSTSTIQFVDEGSRAEELATKSSTKPQSLEKPKVE